MNEDRVPLETFEKQLDELIAGPNESSYITNKYDFRIFLNNEQNFQEFLTKSSRKLSTESYYLLLTLFKRIIACYILSMHSNDAQRIIEKNSERLYSFHSKIRHNLNIPKKYYKIEIEVTFTEFKNALENLQSANKTEKREVKEICELKAPDIPLQTLLKIFIVACEGKFSYYDHVKIFFPGLEEKIDFKGYATKYNIEYPIILNDKEKKLYEALTDRKDEIDSVKHWILSYEIYDLVPIKYKQEMLQNLLPLLTEWPNKVMLRLQQKEIDSKEILICKGREK